jgi:curli biogenesis system outer membrane secretion channel CsgG
MKKNIILIFLFFVACISPQIAINKKADFSKIKRVAVLNFTGSVGNVSSEIISLTLLRHGADVVDRENIEKILNELNLSKSDIIDPQTRKKIGKILGADAIITGSVTKYRPETKYIMKNSGNNFYSITELKGKSVFIQNFDPTTDTSIIETTAQIGLSLKMIDIETGSILFQAYMDYEGIDTESAIQTISEYIVASLAKYWKEIN